MVCDEYFLLKSSKVFLEILKALEKEVVNAFEVLDHFLVHLGCNDLGAVLEGRIRSLQECAEGRLGAELQMTSG